MFLEKCTDEKSKVKKPETSQSFIAGNAQTEHVAAAEKCYICGGIENHVLSVDGDGQSCIEYIACKKFVDLKSRDRDKLLYKRRLCSKCLKPGVKWNSNHFCSKQYTCNQTYEKEGKHLKCEKHVLVCGFHFEEKGNQEILKLYRKNVIEKGNFQVFSKNVSISCFSEAYNNGKSSKSHEDSSIFLFQRIEVEGIEVNIFFDSGCGDLVVRKGIVDKLQGMGQAKLEFSGPFVLNGVGRQESICKHGVYSINLPLGNGSQATMCGVCVDEITLPFPKYPLKKVEKDFHNAISGKNRKLLKNLPKLPDYVGGTVDVMLGKQYLKYFPKEIAQLDTGLTLYKSCFKSFDGTCGIIAGPHAEFTKIDRSAHFAINKKISYFTLPVQKYNEYFALGKDVPLLINKNLDDFSDSRSDYLLLLEDIPNRLELENNEYFLAKKGPRNLKKFEKIEEAGTNISYRCVKCRNCLDCKHGSRVEEISIQEEVEQNLIDRSVTVDVGKHVCTAKLPFLADPDSRLVPNSHLARKVYNGQVLYTMAGRVG